MSRLAGFAHLAAALIGWLALTQGIAALTGRPDVVWWSSIGLLLLSCHGWGPLRVLATAGLYTLSRKREA